MAKFKIQAEVDIEDCIAELPFVDLVTALLENEAEPLLEACLDYFSATAVLEKLNLDDIKQWLKENGGES